MIQRVSVPNLRISLSFQINDESRRVLNRLLNTGRSWNYSRSPDPPAASSVGAWAQCRVVPRASATLPLPSC